MQKNTIRLPTISMTYSIGERPKASTTRFYRLRILNEPMRLSRSIPSVNSSPSILSCFVQWLVCRATVKAVPNGFLNYTSAMLRRSSKAVDILLARHAGDIRTRKLPGDSLLRIVCESGFVTSLPAVGTDEEPPNFFYKRGNVWQIRFNKGKPLLIQKHRKRL